MPRKESFELRRAAAEGQKSQLRERVERLKQEIEGLESQLKSKIEEISLVEQELLGVTELWQKNLVPINRVMSLRRDVARITGDKGGLIGTIAQTRGKINETELQILAVDQQLRSDVAKEDQIRIGQEALRFSAFSQRTTPELKGEVTRISADVVLDPKTNASFFTIRVRFSDEEVKRLGNVRLVGGMPVEAFMKTQGRTAMSYLVRPLHDQILRAFWEN